MVLGPGEERMVDPDIPDQLARLDPLSLNVNRTIHAIFSEEYDDVLFVPNLQGVV